MAIRREYTSRISRCYAELRNGDRLQQPEFHKLYESSPEGFRAELIDGTVYVSEPISNYHARSHSALAELILAYSRSTPGTETFLNASVMLGPEDEVQPDVTLRIEPESGGQTKDVTIKRLQYTQGGPELVAEVAFSSRALDLHLKRRRYAVSGVLEYVVMCLEPKRLYWFDLRNNTELLPNSSGVIESLVFPGLWLHNKALFEGRRRSRALEVLSQGIASNEHIAFVAEMQSRSKQ